MPQLVDYKDIDEVFDGPPVVYKYRSWNDGDNYEVNSIITERVIRLSSPAQLLADYPECILPYNFDSITEEDLRKVAYQHAKQDYPRSPPSKIRRLVPEYRKRMKIFDKTNQERTTRFYDNELYKCTGVFCTSYDCESAEVWENLGCLATNYCVGFKTTELFKVPKVSGSIGYVAYYPEGNPPKVLPYSFSERERLDKVDLTLRSVPDTYSHEKEYRFTTMNADPLTRERKHFTDRQRLVKLPLSVYDCILLGENMSDYDENEVVTATRENLPDIPIFKMKWNKGGFYEKKQVGD